MVSSFCLFLFLIDVAVYSDEPPAVTITLEGRIPFTTNGTENMTLVGHTKGMTRSPHYTWGGLCSSNTNTCTIRPQPEENGKRVICTATDPVAEVSVTGAFYLNLTFPPKVCNKKENDQPQEPQELTQEGLNIFLIANPVPNSFSYSRHWDGNVTTDSTQLDRMFNTACSQKNDTHVLCELRLSHGNSSEEYSGLFNLKLSNDIGSCTLPFEIKQKVLSPNKQDSPKMGTDFRTYAVVLSVLMGVMLLVVATVTTFARWNLTATPVKSAQPVLVVEEGNGNAAYVDPEDCQPTVHDFPSQQDGGDEGLSAQDPCNDCPGQQDGGDEGLSAQDPDKDFPGQQDGGDRRFSDNEEPDDVFKRHTTDQTPKLTLSGDEFSDDSLC